MKEDARINLNGLFNDADYPSEAKIVGKYGFTVEVSPLPDKSDFRVNLADEEVEKIKVQIENRVESAKAFAMKDLWNRLYDVVAHMQGKLADSEAIFRNSLVENICKLCELLPKLNIDDDPALETMRQEVERKLCQVDAETLRTDLDTRQETAQNAQAILDAMSAYMG